MSIEEYQKRHLEKWIEAEEERGAFRRALKAYRLFLIHAGGYDDQEALDKKIAKIEAINSTRRKQRMFIQTTQKALSVLFGVSPESAIRAISIVNEDASCFKEGMERLDMISRMLRDGNPETVRSLLEEMPGSRSYERLDRQLDWQNAELVFREYPELFGFETETGENNNKEMDLI